MEELKLLLERQIILKEKDSEMYYRIKDKYKELKKFIVEKLGYELLIRSDFIKLEKLPGRAQEWMGIENFENPREYVFLMLLFIFLENKNKEEQFLLSHITEFIEANSLGEAVEWTSYKNRRSLIKIIKFAIEESLVKITDGEEDSFIKDESKEVLFESTGLSRYMPRNFSFNIMDIESVNHLEEHTKALLRRHTVYRRLLISPIVYNEGSMDEDYAYIKQHRSIIEKDFEEYLGWQLHVHRNGAMMIPHESDKVSYTFPRQSALSDVVLHLNKFIYEKLALNEVELQTDDCMIISKEIFREWIKMLKETMDQGWSKEYREASIDKLAFDIGTFMRKFQMIGEIEEKIIIYPLVAKVIGGYPKDFRKDEQHE
ncbi:MAG: TIGR02678 family protein [Cellulosilyticaceae bacterium]